MENKVLVTGATGKVGAEVIEQLIRKGVPVKAGARNLDKAPTTFRRYVEDYKACWL